MWCFFYRVLKQVKRGVFPLAVSLDRQDQSRAKRVRVYYFHGDNSATITRLLESGGGAVCVHRRRRRLRWPFAIDPQRILEI